MTGYPPSVRDVVHLLTNKMANSRAVEMILERALHLEWLILALLVVFVLLLSY
ncbi:MAG: hypothetical protein ACXADC_17575 [Candidatus Thorarchaeota archaeon]|jgi:hypothetical protein